MSSSRKIKKATVKIIESKKAVPNKSKIYYKKIVSLKGEIIAAKLRDDNNYIKILKQEMRRYREALKHITNEYYVLSIYVPRYNREMIVEVDRDLSDPKGFKKMVKNGIQLAYQSIRRTLKSQPHEMLFGKRFRCVREGTKEKGLVFSEPHSILTIHVEKNMKTLLEGKVPTMPRKYVGIELEFCAPISKNMFALKLFQNGIHKFAQLKDDGSLRPQGIENGFELAILLEESNYKKGLKKITDVLKEIKAVAKDRRCGLHVHLDMRRRNKELVYNNLVACQYALLSVVSPERYNNEFCRVVKKRDFPTEFTGERVERYKTINAAAYYKYKTLEVRMHEGSVSFNEVSHWVDLLIKVGNYPKKLKNDVTKIPVLQNRLKLKKKLYSYALERSCSWQVQNNPNARLMREDLQDRPIQAQQPGPELNLGLVRAQLHREFLNNPAAEVFVDEMLDLPPDFVENNN